MQLLVIGGAGHVGSIIQPALEAQHECRYLDINPVPGAEDRTCVADLNDDDALRAELAGVDAVVSVALGASAEGEHRRYHHGKHGNPDAAFDVNVKGLYRVLMHGLALGVRRFVHASTLSVYHENGLPYPVTEDRPADEWGAYGMSKRLSEDLCAAASAAHPDATLLALRLLRPVSERDLARAERRYYKPRDKSRDKPRRKPRRTDSAQHPIQPEDLRRLFAAAVDCDKPGFHVIHASGDVQGTDVPHDRAQDILGWQPRAPRPTFLVK